LRFQTGGEETISLPQAPGPGAVAPLDDEFEHFGAPVQHVKTVAFSQSTRPSEPPRSIEPTQTASSRPPSEVVEIGFSTPDQSEGIDFNALLADAVESPPARSPTLAEPTRASPFGRISQPRGGAGASDDITLGAVKPLSPTTSAATVSAPLPGAAADDFDAMFDLPVAAATDGEFEDISVGLSAGAEDVPEPVVVRRPPPRVRPARRPSGPSRPLRAVAVALVLFAVGLGIAAQFMGYGWFASKLWLTHDDATSRARSRARTDTMLKDVHLLDTRASYREEIKRLEQIVSVWKSDKEAHAALLDRYLDLLEREPVFLHAEAALAKGLEAELARGIVPKRLDILRKLAAGEVAEAATLAAELRTGTVDDVGVFVRLRLAAQEQQLREQSLTNPGLTSAAQRDPLRADTAADAGLAEARKALASIQEAAARAPNAMKFKVLDATLHDRMGEYAEAIALLETITPTVPEHVDARLTLASSYLESSHLERADTLVAEAMHIATDVAPDKLRQQEAWLVTARIAAKRGSNEALIKALQAALLANPADELSTLRLGRLLMAEKRGDEAHRLFAAGKSLGFKSIAFEVALVEHWLYINRSEDALAEIVEATKLYPNSVDLLYLRGQVEDKQSHFATARDYFSQVIAREPRHQRAIARLAELQSAAGRHDEALATLNAAQAKLGDDEDILRRISEELEALGRGDEARKILDILLKIAPDNRTYLLRAAQLDLKVGETERALSFLQRLRKNHALNRDAGLQLARALAQKGRADEAAATLTPFAEQEPNDVALNTQAGAFLIDAKDYDRAATALQRATTVANGRDAQALFQFGRLAFRRGDPTLGVQRIKQAIALDASAPEFHLELAKSLFDIKGLPDARKLAVAELETLLASETAYAKAGRALPDPTVVHALLARALFEDHRYAQAIDHLRAVTVRHPDDAEAMVQLGRALYYGGRPDAAITLRDALRLRPADGTAALYLGLLALKTDQSSEAMRWLHMAAQTHRRDTAEAWYHLALIHKDRAQYGSANNALTGYFADAAADDPYRKDAQALQRAVANLK